MVISMLQNLQLRAVASPEANAFGVHPRTGEPGTVTATLGSPSGFDWPPSLVNCAQNFGITLPSLNSVGDYKINWPVTSVLVAVPTTWCASATTTVVTGCGLAAVEGAKTENTFDSRHMAKMSYLTSTESEDQATRGTPIAEDYVTVNPMASPYARSWRSCGNLSRGSFWETEYQRV